MTQLNKLFQVYYIPNIEKFTELPDIKNKLLNNYIPYESNDISLKLFQVYHIKDNIPNYVYTNIKKFAPEYEHHILDDDECIFFFKKYFKPVVLDTFNDL